MKPSRPNKPAKSESQKTEKTVQQKTLFSQLLPHATAVLIFIVITFLFFNPMLIDNKVINQEDIRQGRGASKELADYRAAHNGEEALWTNSMFGGMPAFQISTYYYGNFARYIDKVLSLGFPHPSRLMFIALLGFYLLLIALNVNPWLSIAGAIAFALSTYDLVILDAGHNSKMGALGYVPMVLAGVLLVFYRKKYLFGTAVTALAGSLEIRANHLQITYYLFLILLVLGVTEFISTLYNKQWRHFLMSVGLLAVAAVFGALSNLSMLWSTSQYGAETIRGKSELSSNTQSKGGLDEDYAFGWSNGKMETFTMLIPGFNGGSTGERLSENSNTGTALKQQGATGEQLQQYLGQMPVYWGDKPFTSGPAYIGAITCLLFVLGMFLLKENLKWWLFSASVLGILLSWGHNFFWFNDFVFHYLPAYNKFRTPEMALVIPQICFPILGFLTLAKIVSGEFEKKEVITKLKLSLYIVGGLCLFFVVLGPAFFDFSGKSDKQMPDWLIRSLIDDRRSMMRMDALRSLVFVLLSGGLIWFYCLNSVKQNIFLYGVAALVFTDMFFVGKRYLNNSDFVSKNEYDASYIPSPADEQILQDKSLDYRVLNYTTNTFNDSYTSYFHKSVGGYHAAKLRRYQELIENQISKQSTGVIDMLNTRYFIVPAGKEQQPRAQFNPGALGNAWFPDSVIMVANADEEMNHIGNMYEMKMLDGSSFTVNNKSVTTAVIGNHDKVKIGDTDFDVSIFPMIPGMTDTFGLAQRTNKDGSAEKIITTKSKGAAGPFFTVTNFYEFNPRKDAIIDKRFADYMKGYTVTPDSLRSIRLLSYEPNNLVYQSKTSKEALVVFSEIYYAHGWKSFIDGKEAPHIRADYVLRAMRIPAGEHEIEFKFEPKSYFLGEKIAMVSSALILILFFGVIGNGILKARAKKE